MQQKNKSYSLDLDPVVLYIDDLEQIVSYFDESSIDVDISTDEYVLDNIQELENISTEILTSMTIKSSSPYISLKLYDNSLQVYISNDDAISRGILEKIKQLLISRRRRTFFIYKTWFHSIYGAFGTLSWLIIITGLAKDNIPAILFGIIFAVIIYLMLKWSKKISFKKYCTIYLKKRIDTPSFWKRNRDQITIAIIAALTGGLVTLLLTWILN